MKAVTNEPAPIEEAKAPSEEAPPAGLAARLGASLVGVRRDLEVSRHVFRGEVSYVVRDPLTFQSHRLGAQEYKLFNSIRADTPLAENFAALTACGLMSARDEEPFYRFVMSLHRLGFLKLPIQDDAALYERFVERTKGKRRQRWTMIFSAQIPLINPDAFLNHTVRFARPFFSAPAYVAWALLMGAALWAGLRNAAEFSAPVMDVFSGSNLPLLWVTLVGLKVVHEFGHAYACKLYGGRVPEMGVMLIACAPLAYMDASSSWSFPKKSQRILVCLAGMYVEMAFAAVAMLLWCTTPPGVWRSVLHNTVLLASVTTVLMNINPLMRYDGYFALADVLELPNLRARSNAYATAVLKYLLVGVPPNCKDAGLGLKAFFLVFGIASTLYRITVVLGISAMIATKYLVAGTLIGGLYILNSGWGVLKKSLPYLLKSDETAPRRFRAVTVALLFFLALPIGLFAVPIPSTVVAPGLIASHADKSLRAETPGFLGALFVTSGDRVAPGESLMNLVDPAFGSELAAARARLQTARIGQRALLLDDPVAAAAEAQRAAQAERDEAHWAGQLAGLEITSADEGLIVWALDAHEIGRWIEVGEVVAKLSPAENPCRGALALFDAADLAGARPTPGTRVHFQPASRPGLRLAGTIRTVTPVGSKQLDPLFQEHLDMAALALDPTTGLVGESQFVIEVDLDSEGALEGWESGYLAPGLSGQLRLDADPTPLGLIALRKVLVFLARLG